MRCSIWGVPFSQLLESARATLTGDVLKRILLSSDEIDDVLPVYENLVKEISSLEVVLVATHKCEMDSLPIRHELGLAKGSRYSKLRFADLKDIEVSDQCVLHLTLLFRLKSAPKVYYLHDYRHKP